MNKYTFSTQTGKAYYCNSIPGFIRDKSDNIVGQLVRIMVIVIIKINEEFCVWCDSQK